MKGTFVDFGLLNPSLFIYYRCVKKTWIYASFVHLFFSLHILFRFLSFPTQNKNTNKPFLLFMSPLALKVCKNKCDVNSTYTPSFFKKPSGGRLREVVAFSFWPLLWCFSISHSAYVRVCVQHTQEILPLSPWWASCAGSERSQNEEMHTEEFTHVNSMHTQIFLAWQQTIPCWGERGAFGNRPASGEPQKFHTESLSSSETTSGL